ncbi:MAG: type II toxin-antitoxin system RelE/ParE family toxin [Brachymonas sp.]|nr:type II toxin-antitoxin system RelE/ParE family toxin [Brachymonas sp.]
MKTILYQLARLDINAAQDWYNDEQPGLGEEFTDEFYDALQWLERQPGMGSKRYAHLMPGAQLRCWSLDRFPFLLFYRCVQRTDGMTLEVIRVIHENRDIAKAWLKH